MVIQIIRLFMYGFFGFRAFVSFFHLISEKSIRVIEVPRMGWFFKIITSVLVILVLAGVI